MSSANWRPFCPDKDAFLGNISVAVCVCCCQTGTCLSGLLQYPLYSGLAIYHSLFSPNNSRKTPIARPLGRGMVVFGESLVWSKLYLYCAVYSIVFFCTAIYRESIVSGRVIKVWNVKSHLFITSLFYYKLLTKDTPWLTHESEVWSILCEFIAWSISSTYHYYAMCIKSHITLTS